MADVKQATTEATKINDRLRTAPLGREPAAVVTTQPLRTVTTVYHSGSQSQHGDQPKGGRNNG
ncbi:MULTISPECIES: hypothetical protein [Bradyrhizobium]|uniref:Uncharacterized protein n=1 Tax=Bradyrhizobium diazoefficiens TaxID=1355477 RepID=A0A810A9M0_9BRAD|nr:hypothetical protein [Bradyrhizobium diazoefficiens]MBP1060759.1 hypothetical protein [Bradyrhizobium japonicum]AWO87699.1 hypothetical protein DI395_03380 [Bradyrhizobium diazoefficiens]BBZ90748.1 hypothetical protein F07S3_05810 [Bradyrhizobium diazoefficiens]BCA08734.1 hypothetical protein BDHF08_05810 [Bradyrhizobium diazoefficiens]BCE53070.1 hypothetical protein XF5B_05820 [Bradyrhizobium diazoefficiens]